jgi:hypothetical protein
MPYLELVLVQDFLGHLPRDVEEGVPHAQKSARHSCSGGGGEGDSYLVGRSEEGTKMSWTGLLAMRVKGGAL